MIPQFIIAGNANEYQNWLRKQIVTDTRQYLYVHTPEVIRGIRDPHGKFIGTYKNRPDIKLIVNLLILSIDRVDINHPVHKLAVEIGVIDPHWHG
jgi:hypothetical protein